MALILYAKNKITVQLGTNCCTLVRIILLILIAINNCCFAEKAKTFQENLRVKDKYHLLQVEILGVNKELTETIEKDLLIFHATTERKLTKTRIENLHDRTNDEITNNLQSLGYYHAKVTNASLREVSHHHWLASYKIELGNPTLIKQINLQLVGTACNNHELSKKIKQLSIKFLHKNEPLHHDDYEKTKQFILNNLHDYGFLDAEFTTSKIEINTKEYTASIDFVIDSKQQYYLGPVIFESDLYSNDFLQQYVPFKEQEIYLTSHLLQLKNNLLNSGLFSKIRIDTPELAKITNNIVPITVRVYKKPSNSYNGSIGFGTDTGIRGKLGFTRRRPTHPGHQINTSIIGSKIRKEVIADYSFLGNNPMVDTYNFGISGIEERIHKRYDKNASIYIQKSKKYSTRQQFWKLNFLTEKFRVLPGGETRHVKFLMPSLRLSWIHKKNINDPDDIEDGSDSTNSIVFGNKIDCTAKVATRTFGSSNLLQLTINEKWIQPLIYDVHFIFKGTIGTTFIKDPYNLPLSLRFFAGGDHSVRGFAFESLGPTAVDNTGTTRVIGGKDLILGSIELEKPIYKQISGALFIDTGNALNTFNKFNFNKLAVGSGFGLIYRTPIGSVRAYIAKPLRTANNITAKHLRLHLTFDAGL